MTQDENLELSHQHPASKNNFIDSNSSCSSSSICNDQQIQQNEQQQLHQLDINDDLNKSKIITHNTELNSIDENCNSNCQDCNSKCDDENDNNSNNVNEIIKPIMSDILIGISDSINTLTENFTENVKVENELPKTSELQSSLQSELNHITSIDVIQLNDTDRNIKSFSSLSPTKSIDNNNNCVDENETCIVENNIKIFSENKPNNIEDVKFTTVIKNENNFENVHDENEINKISENIEIKNLDNIINSVIKDEKKINTLKNFVILSDNEVNNTVGNLNNDINIPKTDDIISEELENNDKFQLNSEKLNEEKDNSNIVIDENRIELKNQGDFITSENNLIKSDNKIVDEKQLTDNLNENNLVKKQLADDKLNEDPIVRLNKLRANISNALREVKGVLRQYSSNIDKNIDIIDDENKNHCQMAPVTDDSAVVQFRFVRKIRRRSHLSDDDINEVDILNNKLNNNSELNLNKQLDNIPEIDKSDKNIQEKIDEGKFIENIESVGGIDEKSKSHEFDNKDNEKIVTNKKSDIILEIKPENIVENSEIKEENKVFLKDNLIDKNIDLTAGTTANENLVIKPRNKLKKSISIDSDKSIDVTAEQKTIKKKLKKQSSVDNESKSLIGKSVEESSKKKLSKTDSLDKATNKVAKDKITFENKSIKTKLKKQNSMDNDSGTVNNNKSLKLGETTLTKKTLKKQTTISNPESSVTATNKVTEIKNENVPNKSKIPISVSKNDKIVTSQKNELKSDMPVKVNIADNQTESKISEKSEATVTKPDTTLPKSPKTTLLDEVVQLLKKPKEKPENLPQIAAADKNKKSSNTVPAKIEPQVGISSTTPELSATQIEKKIVEQQQIKDTKPSNNLVDIKNENLMKNIPEKSTEIVSKNSLLSEVEKLLTTSKTATKEKPEVLPNTIPIKSTEAENSQQSKSKVVAQPQTVAKSESQNALQKNSAPLGGSVGKQATETSVNVKNKLETSSKLTVSQENKSVKQPPNEITPKIPVPVINKTKNEVTNTSNALNSSRLSSSSANKSTSNATVNSKDIKQDINQQESAKVPVVTKQDTNSKNPSQELNHIVSEQASSTDKNEKPKVANDLNKVSNSINSTKLEVDVKQNANESNSIIAPKNNNQVENKPNSQKISTEITQIENKSISTTTSIEVKDDSIITSSSIESNQTDRVKLQEMTETITSNLNSQVNTPKDETVSQINSITYVDTVVEEEDVPLSPHVPKDDFAKKISTLKKKRHEHSATETETENEAAEDEEIEPDKVKERKKRKATKKVVIRRVKRKLSIAEGFAQAPLPEAETEVCEKEIFKDDELTTKEAAAEEFPKEKPIPKSCLKVRAYEPGDLVMYADRVKKTQVKWRLATVVERITSISYKLNIEGEEKTCHLSYIKKHTNKKLTFGGKEYLEIDYAQIEADEEKERNYSIWNLV